ncbi:MAG: UDP-3-O-(3-hydroxymyristoyl)glucosamine N-acyltransferase [Cyclobacteriaceae bacterium]|nr:UDP-3-O-(3-hydroxymyristoyl)glucosamine N-acyltransferase [Cyclobacteriaceae bacterium]
MEFSVNQIAQLLNGIVEGDGERKISGLGKIQEALSHQLAFLSNPKYEQFIYTTKAGAVMVRKDFAPENQIETTLIKVEDPYASFTVLLEEYHKAVTYSKSGVEEPCFLGENSTVGDDVYRGAFSYIGKNVTIGKNVKIYPNAYIGSNCKVGDNSIIYAGAKLYEGTIIGNNCTIHSGAVLGSDGFGFAPQQDGTYKAIPQMGHVVLEDNVSIGANTVIDCATFQGDATTIKNGTKLDNLIQIAHNVTIGKNTVIAAQTGISGSTEVGDNCVFAGQVGVVGHIKIANKTTIGAKAGIPKSNKKEGEVLFGEIAFDIKDYMKCYAIFKKLPDINNRLRELEKKS